MTSTSTPLIPAATMIDAFRCATTLPLPAIRRVRPSSSFSSLRMDATANPTQASGHSTLLLRPTRTARVRSGRKRRRKRRRKVPHTRDPTTRRESQPSQQSRLLTAAAPVPPPLVPPRQDSVALRVHLARKETELTRKKTIRSEKRRHPARMQAKKACETRKLRHLKFPADVRKQYLQDTDVRKLAHVREIVTRLGMQDSLFIAFQIGTADVFYGERLDLADGDRRRVCAVKVIALANNYNENLKTSPIRQCAREVEFYQRTAHSPNVVDMYQFDFDARTSTFLVTLEYSCYRDLFDLIALKRSGFGVEQARCIFSQIAQGVNFLHREGIAHRDIKPGNIIYCGGCFKLCDLGLACDLENDSEARLNTVCGTAFYISYSVAERIEQPVRPLVDHLSQPDEWARTRRLLWNPRKNDVWALGVVLHMLLVGTLPYSISGQNLHRYAAKMRLAALAGFRMDARHEDGCVDLLDHMLTFDERKRYTIRNVLRHHWVRARNLATRSASSLPLSSADRAELHRANYRKPSELA